MAPSQPGPPWPVQSAVQDRGLRPADELALAYWPAGHRVLVCSLSGGTGRTTVAGLIALTLAGLPYSHVHPPVCLAEPRPEPLSTARHRWGALHGSPDITVTRAGGSVRLVETIEIAGGPPTVVDAPTGLAEMVELATADHTASLVLLTRPDRTSLADAAEALVWLEDTHGVRHDRTTVVINHGCGHPDRGSKPAATALWIRCATVHNLPSHRTLGPGRVLPSGHGAPRSLRDSLIALCLDIYRSNLSVVAATVASQEDSHA